jgi:hypothetical protein
VTRIRDLVALGTAVAACTVVVVMPTVARSRAPAPNPATLAGAWPTARPFDMPATVLSGQSYTPQVIVAAGVSIGTVKTPDGTGISLVEVTSTRTPATVRVLQSGLSSSKVSYDAFAVTGTDVYAMRNTTNDDGAGVESLWRIPRAGGRPTLLLADAGGALFQGSADDLQVADGTLRWIATAPQDPSATLLDSMPLPAGPVRSRLLSDQYTLTTYPMLFTSQPRDSPAPTLTDSITGQVTAMHTTQPGTLCDPLWCILQAADDTGANTVQLCHPDGRECARLGDANTSLVTTDPTLSDRFVALLEQQPTMANSPNPTVQVFLYDIGRRRTVEVTNAASATFGAGRWLWWSTGDNETLAWHALDINTLR